MKIEFTVEDYFNELRVMENYYGQEEELYPWMYMLLQMIEFRKKSIEEDYNRLCIIDVHKHIGSNSDSKLKTINEQISNFAQTYPTNLKASSNEALLFMRRYRFANCSCFSCCFKDAYPSSNVQ